MAKPDRDALLDNYLEPPPQKLCCMTEKQPTLTGPAVFLIRDFPLIFRITVNYNVMRRVVSSGPWIFAFPANCRRPCPAQRRCAATPGRAKKVWTPTMLSARNSVTRPTPAVAPVISHRSAVASTNPRLNVRYPPPNAGRSSWGCQRERRRRSHTHASDPACLWRFRPGYFLFPFVPFLCTLLLRKST